MKVSRVDEICQNLPYMNGAKETVQELKAKGYKVVCFSGGYKKIFALEPDKKNFPVVLHPSI